MFHAFEDAKARSTALVAKDAKDVEARVLLANALSALYDTTSALAQIQEALKIDPRNARALVTRVSILALLGLTKEAEA